MDLCIIVQFLQNNPTRCNSVTKFIIPYLHEAQTCFGRQTTHHQEPKTALAASGFAYMESCWMCGCWTLTAASGFAYMASCWPCGCWMLSASSNHTSTNFPCMPNQRLPVQFWAPDDGQCVARNMSELHVNME